MDRSTKIVLGTPDVPPPPEAKARPVPARHWRHWRNGGAALSVLLHVVAITALTVNVPVFGGVAEEETAIPVEIVQRAPERKAEEPKAPAETKPIPAPPKVEPPKPDLAKPETPPAPIAKPPPPRPAPAAPKPKVAGPPPAIKPPAAAKPAPAPAAPQPEIAQPPSLPIPAPGPSPEARLAPPPAALPEPPRPAGPQAGLKVDPDEIPLPRNKKAIAYWVLEPLVANLGHKCGLARITGVLELTQRVAEGRYRGTMHTRISWATCPAEGVVHSVEMRIKGGEVEMVGASFVDRGVIGSNTMMLEDRFGRSVWKKR